mmetsp:Transcript_6555/g.19464  ORF Transcript_6555/g.19464 Transcript_6555/m.19464 type:complete len:252 (+) Transcript_6555:717-1472(+)
MDADIIQRLRRVARRRENAGAGGVLDRLSLHPDIAICVAPARDAQSAVVLGGSEGSGRGAGVLRRGGRPALHLGARGLRLVLRAPQRPGAERGRVPADHALLRRGAGLRGGGVVLRGLRAHPARLVGLCADEPRRRVGDGGRLRLRLLRHCRRLPEYPAGHRQPRGGPRPAAPHRPPPARARALRAGLRAVGQRGHAAHRPPGAPGTAAGARAREPVRAGRPGGGGADARGPGGRSVDDRAGRLLARAVRP